MVMASFLSLGSFFKLIVKKTYDNNTKLFFWFISCTLGNYYEDNDMQCNLYFLNFCVKYFFAFSLKIKKI